MRLRVGAILADSLHFAILAATIARRLKRGNNDCGFTNYRFGAMNTYETSTTVQDHGHIALSGLPFASGTKVEVTINVLADPQAVNPTERAKRLFAAMDKARNVDPIGPFERGERDVEI